MVLTLKEDKYDRSTFRLVYVKSSYVVGLSNHALNKEDEMDIC